MSAVDWTIGYNVQFVDGLHKLWLFFCKRNNHVKVSIDATVNSLIDVLSILHTGARSLLINKDFYRPPEEVWWIKQIPAVAKGERRGCEHRRYHVVVHANWCPTCTNLVWDCPKTHNFVRLGTSLIKCDIRRILPTRDKIVPWQSLPVVITTMKTAIIRYLTTKHYWEWMPACTKALQVTNLIQVAFGVK